MQLHQIHHVAVIGSDYGASRHFYVDVLGFRVVRENFREERGDWKIDLACGDGKVLRILELQAQGGKRMAAAAYLAGHPIQR